MNTRKWTVWASFFISLALTPESGFGSPDEIYIEVGTLPQANGVGAKINSTTGVATLPAAVKIKEGSTAVPAADGRLLELQFISEVVGAPVTTPTPGPTPTPTPTSTATPTPTTTATPYFAPYASIKAIDRSVIDSPLYDLSVVGKKLQFSTGSTLYGATQKSKEWLRINPNGSIIVNPTGYEGSSSALEAGPGHLFKMNMSLWLEDGEVRQIVNSENSTLQKPAGGDGLPDQYAPLFIGYRRLPTNDRPLPGDVLARFAGAGLDGQSSGCGSAGGFDAACGSSWGGYMQFVLEPFLPLDTPVPHAAGTMPSRFELYLTPHGSDIPELYMTVRQNGWVGIGTGSPEFKLDVVGGPIHASGGIKTDSTFDSTGSSYNDGSVIFVATSEEVTGLQVTGLREDGNNFFWDNSNKRLGLAFGGASPTLSNTLDVHGTVAIGAGYAGASAAPGNGLIVQGTVGIGTDEPDDENFILDVNGNTNITGDLIVGGEIIGGGGGCDECEFVLDGENVTGILPLAKGGTNKNGYVFDGAIPFYDEGGATLAEDSRLRWDGYHGRLGIGMDAPVWDLEIQSANLGPYPATAARLTTWISGQDRFDGAAFMLLVTENSESEIRHDVNIANFEHGSLAFVTGAVTDEEGFVEGANPGALELTEGSNLLLGFRMGVGTPYAGEDARNAIVMQAEVAPSSNLPDEAQLYALALYDDVEETTFTHLFVEDESGVDVDLSPHVRRLLPPDESEVAIPWTSYSKSQYLGVEQNVDMAGVVKAVEQLSGKQFIYTHPLPEGELRGWYGNQEKEKVKVEAARRKEAMKAEIEISREDAIEQVALTAKVTTTVEKTEYKLDVAMGNLVAVTKQVPVQQEIPTGQTGYKLKSGVRLDEKTGKLYRHKTAEEVEIELYEIKAPPAWMAQRLASAQ